MSENKGFFNFDKLVANLTGYAETKIQLLRLDAREKVAFLLAHTLKLALLLLFISLALIFLSVTLSIKINLILESDSLGYLVVASIYFIIILSFVLFVNKSSFYRKLAQRIIDSLEEPEDEDTKK